MGRDPLAQFRKAGQSGNIGQPARSTGQYIAYEKAEGRPPVRLLIRRLMDVSHAPDYRLLSNIIFNDYGMEFALWYPFMQVKVKGRNLTPVVEAILAGHCVFIQDFDAREYSVPLAKDQPVIERIDILLAGERGDGQSSN